MLSVPTSRAYEDPKHLLRFVKISCLLLTSGIISKLISGSLMSVQCEWGPPIVLGIRQTCGITLPSVERRHLVSSKLIYF